MPAGKLVLAQLMEFLPRHEFDVCVGRYAGDRRPRGFSCRDQFLYLAFGQLTFRESLRDIETCLRAMPEKLYHAGFRGRVSKSTLADANIAHDWRVYADFAQVLIARARILYAQDEFGATLTPTAYALDSTTIDLCLALLPWAKFRQRKGAVKLHTLLDLRGNIPCFIRVTHGKTHDVNVLDHLPWDSGAFYGHTENAEQTQVWIAIGVYVPVAIVKKELHIDRSLSDIPQILSVTLFERTEGFKPLFATKPDFPPSPSHNRLTLFDLKPDSCEVKH